MHPRRIKRSLPATLSAWLIIAAAGCTLCLVMPAGRPTAAASGEHPSVPSAAQVSASPSATPRRLNGRIAYVSGDPTNFRNRDIWVMNPDGSNFTNLTPNTPQSVEGYPAWSPDGAKLVFTRADLLTGEIALFVMNADGSSQTKLPTASRVAWTPAWSPDGAKIAFSVPLNQQSSDIHVIDADGSREVKLTDKAGNDSRPTWSPDGSRIAFDSASRPSGDGIYVMNADGSNQRRIVDDSSVKGAHSPKWSPDGSLIMFSGGRFRNPGPAKAYLVSPDGANLTHVNEAGAPYYDPAWSPDGRKIVFRTHDEPAADIGVINLDGTGFTKFSPNVGVYDDLPAWQPLVGGEQKIVFTSTRDGNPEIYVMEADGRNQSNLTNHPARDATPVWSPDRRRVAFTSDRSGRSNIYVMDADGGNVRAVTNFDNTSTDYRVYDPAWSPDGAKLVFVGSMMGEVSGLVVVNADGSGDARPILEGSTEVADPAWSPDGSRIAYVGREPSLNPEDNARFYIFVINADGSGKTRIVSNVLPFSSFPYPPQASGPAWSPDGEYLAFSYVADSNSTIPQIYHVKASGSVITPVTNHPSAHTQPGWTADNRIVFTTDRDGQREIYKTSVDARAGEESLVRLTQNTADDYDANSQPDPVVPQRAPSTLQWRNQLFRVREGGAGGDPVVVTRLGDLSRAASVDYETADFTAVCETEADCPRRASERSDYIRTAGTIHFAPGESSKSIHIPLVDDTFVEGDQLFYLILTNVVGATLTEQTSFVVITDNDSASTPAARNPIDEPNFFVRMHYLDFLGREPEPSGQEAWVGVWNRCPDINRDERCDRVTISSAFFRSQEFHMRGFFVYRFYRVSFNRRPTYAEFLRDTARITGQTLAEIDASKDAFALAWVQREDFRAAYLGSTASEYVGRLEANAGVVLTGDVTRASLEADLIAGRRFIPGVLRAIAEHPNVEAAHYNEAFVTMQYFGYLKRDPEEEGFQNWLRVINRGDGYRVMVHGFVNSVEYRARFGTP
ncbi:MAG TPA: Calx-beta domain-containing protein [Pyrinomonadaceae bacterium]